MGVPIQNLALPANGFVSYDNILAALNTTDYFGPIEIRSTNGAPLAAVSRVSGLNADTSGFFSALPADSGQLIEIIPFAIDTNAFRTNLGINNLGTTMASVNVSLIGADGTVLAGTTSPQSVARSRSDSDQQYLEIPAGGFEQRRGNQHAGIFETDLEFPHQGFCNTDRQFDERPQH